MSNNSLTKIEELFLQVVNEPEAERRTYLRRACADDPQLQCVVESLLCVYDDSSPSILDLEVPQDLRTGVLTRMPNATVSTCLDHQPGESLGQYVLLRKLGAGGMGIVYLARETEPIQRLVALKLLKSDLATAAMIHRFAAERQALALMQHPAIPRIFNAGIMPNGRQFLAMEYFEGTSITQFCAERFLTVPQRVSLFTKVCEAIGYIHRRGVIHLDIKPSNVIVVMEDDHPVPRLIDFGIAQSMLLNAASDQGTSESAQVLGTVDYMSPEQSYAGREVADVRSDIYSLGALLYELLTGQTPFAEWQTESLSKRLDALRHRNPRELTVRTIVGTATDQVDARRLNDVTMKCLSRSPDDRYQSTACLIADLQECQTPAKVAVSIAQSSLRRRLQTSIAAAMTVALLLLVSFNDVEPNTNYPQQFAVTDTANSADPANESFVRIDAAAYQQIADILRDNGVEATAQPLTIAAEESTDTTADFSGTPVVTLIPARSHDVASGDSLVNRGQIARGHSG